jgi:hypothetical protein
MDADLSHDPKVIKKIINLLKAYPFVIGSRYIKSGKCDLKGFRFFISYLGNIFIKFFLKINSHEFTTSYRGFNLIKLKGLDIIKTYYMSNDKTRQSVEESCTEILRDINLEFL